MNKERDELIKLALDVEEEVTLKIIRPAHIIIFEPKDIIDIYKRHSEHNEEIDISEAALLLDQLMDDMEAEITPIIEERIFELLSQQREDNANGNQDGDFSTD